MPNANVKHYLHLHFIVFVWGFTAILGELISIKALDLVWYRMVIASVLILIYMKWMQISFRVTKKLLWILIISGIVIALHWITFFGAIKASNVSLTLAILSSGAFFTSILEPVFYKRKLIWYEVIFGVVVIAGLYMIFTVEASYTKGILYAICSAFLSAVFSLINGKLAKKYNPSMVSFYELSTGAGILTLYLFGATVFGSLEAGFSLHFFQLSLKDWAFLLILASVCTAYAFIASVKVMKYISPYTVMLTINLEPVYGIILAFLIFGDAEKMNPGFYYGALVILSTVLLNGILKNLKKIKRRTS